MMFRRGNVTKVHALRSILDIPPTRSVLRDCSRLRTFTRRQPCEIISKLALTLYIIAWRGRS
jgi:hypothetical protein